MSSTEHKYQYQLERAHMIASLQVIVDDCNKKIEGYEEKIGILLERVEELQRQISQLESTEYPAPLGVYIEEDDE